MKISKKSIVEAVIAELREKVALHAEAARTAHAEATHEENVAEDKYDTRGLEASYLAAGQSRQMAETAAALHDFSSLFLKKFGPDDPVDVSALVELESRGKRMVYFVGPSGGGIEVDAGGVNVIVVTPLSPLGAKLTGLKQGGRFKLKIGPFTDDYRLVSVS